MIEESHQTALVVQMLTLPKVCGRVIGDIVLIAHIDVTPLLETGMGRLIVACEVGRSIQ